MALRTTKRRPVGTWSAQRRQDAMEQSREAARGPMDLPFLLLTLLLTAMGMVMVLSASFPSAYYENGGNGAYYFIRQGIFALLGLAVMFALSKLNYQRLRGVGRLRDSSSTAQFSARTISPLLHTWSSGKTSPVKGSVPSAKMVSSSFARCISMTLWLLFSIFFFLLGGCFRDSR